MYPSLPGRKTINEGEGGGGSKLSQHRVHQALLFEIKLMKISKAFL